MFRWMTIEQNRTTEHEKRGRRGERDKDIEQTMRLAAELPRVLDVPLDGDRTEQNNRTQEERKTFS